MFADDLIIDIYRNHQRLHFKTVRINKSVRLQDTKSIYKNQLHFYTLTTIYQKEKLRMSFIYNRIKGNKILRNEIKGVKTCTLKTMTSVKEIKENTLNLKTFCDHGSA